MYAVVSSGGKQYRVEAGSLLTLERLDGHPGEPGTSVTFDRVLLIADGEEVTVGTPVVAGASVSATVIGEALGPKLVIFKFKQKVKYRRRNGHRQHLTRVRIDTINPTQTSKKAATPKATPEAKPAPKATAAPKSAPKPGADEAASVEPAAPAAEVKAARPRTARPRTAKAEAPAQAATEKPKVRRAAKPKAKE